MQLRSLHGIAVTNRFLNLCWELRTNKHLYIFQIVQFDENPWFEGARREYDECCNLTMYTLTLFKVLFNLEVY